MLYSKDRGPVCASDGLNTLGYRVEWLLKNIFLTHFKLFYCSLFQDQNFTFKCFFLACAWKSLRNVDCYSTLKKYFILRSLWIKFFKTLTRSPAAKFAGFFYVELIKNIPDQRQCDQFGKAPKSTKSLHPTLGAWFGYISCCMIICLP